MVIKSATRHTFASQQPWVKKKALYRLAYLLLVDWPPLREYFLFVDERLPSHLIRGIQLMQYTKKRSSPPYRRLQPAEMALIFFTSGKKMFWVAAHQSGESHCGHRDYLKKYGDPSPCLGKSRLFDSNACFRRKVAEDLRTHIEVTNQVLLLSGAKRSQYQ